MYIFITQKGTFWFVLTVKLRDLTTFVKHCECMSVLKGQGDKISTSQFASFRAVTEGLMVVKSALKMATEIALGEKMSLHK